MRDYIPDKWVLLDISAPTEHIVKVFSGWHGGFADGDSWKLSSGVTSCIDHETYYEFVNYSGSIYKCYKSNMGMSTYMFSIHNHWLNTAVDSDTVLSILDIIPQEFP